MGCQSIPQRVVRNFINGKRNSGVEVVEYYKWYIEVMHQLVYYPEKNCEDSNGSEGHLVCNYFHNGERKSGRLSSLVL